MTERHSHMTSVRFTEAEFAEYTAKAQAKGWSLGRWIRHRCKASSDPAPGVRYVSTNHRAGISISVSNDDRWQTWVHAGWFVAARERPECCTAGHARLEDAIDHGMAILRGDLLAERNTWPADSIGAQLLAKQ